MLTSIRGLLAATVLSGSLFVAAPAFAQEAEEASESPISFSANAAITSEYRFRGVDLSGGDIAVQGGVDVGLPAGFYVGTWASSLDEDTIGYGHTELDIYGGWSSDVGGVTVDVGMIAYLYPNAGAGEFDVYEGYVSVAGSLGPASIEVGAAYAPEQDSLDFGGPTDNLYLYTDVGIGVGDSPISLSAHIGYTDGALTYTADSNAIDWSVGADLALGDTISVGAAYMDTEGTTSIGPNNYDLIDDAFVLTLSASF